MPHSYAHTTHISPKKNSCGFVAGISTSPVPSRFVLVCCVGVNADVCVTNCMCVHAHTRVCARACASACVYVSFVLVVCIYMFASVLVYGAERVCVLVRVCVCACVYVCVCVCVCPHLPPLQKGHIAVCASKHTRTHS